MAKIPGGCSSPLVPPRQEGKKDKLVIAPGKLERWSGSANSTLLSITQYYCTLFLRSLFATGQGLGAMAGTDIRPSIFRPGWQVEIARVFIPTFVILSLGWRTIHKYGVIPFYSHGKSPRHGGEGVPPEADCRGQTCWTPFGLPEGHSTSNSLLYTEYGVRSTGFVAIDDMTVAVTVNTTAMYICTTVVRTGCRIQNLHQGPRQQLRPIQDSVVSVYRGIAKLEQYRQWSRSQTKSTALGSLPSFPPRSVRAGHEEMPICTYRAWVWFVAKFPQARTPYPGKTSQARHLFLFFWKRRQRILTTAWSARGYCTVVVAYIVKRLLHRYGPLLRRRWAPPGDTRRYSESKAILESAKSVSTASGGGSSGQAAKWVPPSRGVGSWTTWRSWLSRRKAENPPIFISTNAQHQLVQGKGKDEHPCPGHAWSGFSAAEASNSTIHNDDDTAMGGLRVVGFETRNRLARTPGSFLSSSNHQGLWAMQADDWDTKLLSPLRSKILPLSAPSGRRRDMGQAVL
ncbi:hypothetical protein X797_001943 [Metarhizium robertsii]|uniref:Uncharacterized protein n=1 Tax=Metarhizium robertsii TaxID=568076 RepID=A0A0A1V3Q6_9HYPO|nr:hypothetical protein X797_001943 [Metarhizium robertsii]